MDIHRFTPAAERQFLVLYFMTFKAHGSNHIVVLRIQLEMLMVFISKVFFQQDFFKAKGIKFKNEMLDDSSTLLKAAMEQGDLVSSDEEDAAGINRGSADEDDESPDEDFEAESESDVAEEYDSAHDSESSDAEMGDGDRDDDDEEESRPKKKTKT